MLTAMRDICGGKTFSLLICDCLFGVAQTNINLFKDKYWLFIEHLHLRCSVFH